MTSYARFDFGRMNQYMATLKTGTLTTTTMTKKRRKTTVNTTTTIKKQGQGRKRTLLVP